jgi:hypothetical protein
MPTDIKDQIERETIITQKALWQAKPANATDLSRVKATSNLFLNVICNKDSDKQSISNGPNSKHNSTVENISYEEDKLIT